MLTIVVTDPGHLERHTASTGHDLGLDFLSDFQGLTSQEVAKRLAANKTKTRAVPAPRHSFVRVPGATGPS